MNSKGIQLSQRKCSRNIEISQCHVSARKLIVQFCSLTGAVFPSDEGQMQEQHLLQLLAGILQWINPPDVVSKAIECGKSESEMLDDCRALSAIASIVTPLVFDQLLKSISQRISWMSELLPLEGINLMTNLFALIVESELKAASKIASLDESESEYCRLL
ncbi:hypothetical protein LOK49_LG13G00398 [Camellia lanceoleosa]|uniref:Uncharacterized protein n=1 Tax=Camellia lanceoleosa TaxID=1840588 RepID=A0ACC0FGB9_9ERIC|nr:hypothetical protein LOK49_LG13G00398 [Camellia lanceoleosa]